MDILLTLDECNRNYRHASRHYVELYSNRRHSSVQQVNSEKNVRNKY